MNGESEVPAPVESPEKKIAFDLDSLDVANSVQVETESGTIYLLENRSDGYYLSGSPEYCPNPTKIKRIGWSPGGDIIEDNLLEIGQRMKFILDNQQSASTSKIKSISPIRKTSPETNAE